MNETTTLSNVSSWIKIKPTELNKIVIELAKEGESPAKIGLILRDKHGLPKTKLLGKRIEQILKNEKVDYKNEKKIIENRVDRIKKHLEKNKKDFSATKALTKRLWVLHKLEKKA